MATRIGEHEFEVEAPDLVVMRWRGALTLRDFTRGIDYLHSQCGDWRSMLLIADLSGMTAIPAEVRKVVPDQTAWMPMRGTVISGASFTIRTVAVMLLKIINLVRGTDNPTYYARDEHEARVWIEQRRRELADGGRR